MAPRSTCLLALALVLLASPSAVRAQDDEAPPPSAPAEAPDAHRELPLVLLGTPVVPDGYDSSTVRRAALRGLDGVRRCFEGQRRIGALRVHFTIDARGRATSVRVPALQRGLDVHGTQLAECLRVAIEGWRLTRPSAAPVEVMLPLRLRDPDGGAGYSRAARLPEGRVRVGRPEVRGPLRPAQIRAVVQRHLAELRFCYERELVSHAELAGELRVRFVVVPTGSVSTAATASSTLGSEPVEQCVATAVRRWTFPAPPEGVALVDLPLTLTPRPPRAP